MCASRESLPSTVWTSLTDGRQIFLPSSQGKAPKWFRLRGLKRTRLRRADKTHPALAARRGRVGWVVATRSSAGRRSDKRKTTENEKKITRPNASRTSSASLFPLTPPPPRIISILILPVILHFLSFPFFRELREVPLGLLPLPSFMSALLSHHPFIDSNSV